MKKTALIAFLFTALITGGFFITKKVYASNYTQIRTNGYFHHTAGGTHTTYFNQNGNDVVVDSSVTSGQPAFEMFPGAFYTTAFTNISRVGFIIDNDSGSPDNIVAHVICSDGTGTHTGASYNTTIDTIGTPTGTNFIFATPITCDSTSLVYLFINLDNFAGTQTVLIGTNNTTYLDPAIGVEQAGTPGGTNFNALFQLDINLNSSFIPNSTNTEVPENIVSCPSTTFTLNFGFGKADFGQGTCEVGTYLFVPSQNSLNQFYGLATSTEQKIPFSYFYDITTAVTGQSTTSTATPISFDLVASTTGFSVTYSPFSTSTAVAWMGQTNYDLFQTLMRYGILASFGFYLYFRVKHLLSKHQK